METLLRQTDAVVVTNEALSRKGCDGATARERERRASNYA
jgi:hypothetical protein